MTPKTAEKETALTPTNGSNLPAPLDIMEQVGMGGDFDSDDLTIPIMAINQPTSGSERGDPGKFSFSDGRQVDDMETVVLDIIGTRTLWTPKGEEPDGIVCKSADRRVGETDYPALTLGAEQCKKAGVNPDSKAFIPCKECPHFTDSSYERADYLCKKGFTLLMIDRQTKSPFLFYVKGSAMSIVKKRIVSPPLARAARGEVAAPWTTTFAWTVHLIEDPDRGKWYVPVVVPMQFEGEDLSAEYAGLAVKYSGRAAAITMEDEAPDEGQGEML